MAYDPLLRCDKHDEENCIECAAELIGRLESENEHLRGLLDDADTVTRDAISHVEAGYEGAIESALAAWDGIAWMAKEYAESGGSGGPELRGYIECEQLIVDARRAFKRWKRGESKEEE